MRRYLVEIFFGDEFAVVDHRMFRFGVTRQHRQRLGVGLVGLLGEGMKGLLEAIAAILRQSTRIVELRVPFDRGDIRAMAHREGQVVDESSNDGGWKLRVRVDEGSAGRLNDFLIPSEVSLRGHQPSESGSATT